MKLAVLLSILIATSQAWSEGSNSVDPNLAMKKRDKSDMEAGAPAADFINPESLNPLDNNAEKIVYDWSQVSRFMRKNYRNFGDLPIDDQYALTRAELAAQQLNGNENKAIIFKVSRNGGLGKPSIILHKKTTADDEETVRVSPRGGGGVKVEYRKSAK